MPNRTDTYNELVMAELDKNAVKVLKTHPRDIVERTLHMVGKVFVAKDPDEDSVATKLDVAATMLEKLAAAIRNEENPLNINYPVDEKSGLYYGTPTFKIGTEYATTLLPAEMIDRSRVNRVRAAAKKAAL